jgi:glycosyltransferase involved in cell wall biosynthesis
MSEFTFLITAFNPGKYILTTINSILNQTFSNFYVIYIDDASTDFSLSSLEIIEDRRLRIIKNKHKIGLINSLNMGIDLVTTKYIIRFDADDILLPSFLENKIKHLEEDVILIGENILITDKYLNIKGKTTFPTNDSSIKKQLLRLKSSINQPGVLINKAAVIKAGYYRQVKASEDYDLWLRMMKFGKFKNTTGYQLLYRVTNNSLTNLTLKHIPGQNILSLTNTDASILNSKFAKIYIHLFLMYNNTRGFSQKKIIYYFIYSTYRIIYSKYLTNRYYKLNPADKASL